MLTLKGRAREGANGISLLMKFMKESGRKRGKWSEKRDGKIAVAEERNGTDTCRSLMIVSGSRCRVDAHISTHLFITHRKGKGIMSGKESKTKEKIKKTSYFDEWKIWRTRWGFYFVQCDLFCRQSFRVMLPVSVTFINYQKDHKLNIGKGSF